MIPGGTEEQMRWLDELQRSASDTETAVLPGRNARSADSTGGFRNSTSRRW